MMSYRSTLNAALPFLLPLSLPLLAGCGGEDAASPAAEVFDRSVLHQIEITVAGEHLDALSTNLDARVPCTITYDGETIEEAGIRQKGNLDSLTSLTSKPSFSIKFDEFDESAELFGLHKILLNNAAQDPTFLREHLGSDMYNRAGLPAPRQTHGVVTLNGFTYGLYVVAEAVDKRYLARTFGEPNNDGNLYEGPCCGDFTDIDHMELKDEESDNRSRDDLIELAGVVLNTPDADLEAALRERMDLDGFILGYALDASLDHWDGYSFEKRNNYYMYNNPDDGRFVFIPHGMDRILEDISFDPETFPTARLSQRVREIPALDAAFHAALARVSDELWDLPAINAAIDGTAKVLAGAGTKSERLEGDIAAFTTNAVAWREALTERKGILTGSAP